MRDVGELFAGTPTTNSLSNSNSSTEVGAYSLEKYMLKYPGTAETSAFEWWQAISTKIKEANLAAKDAKKSRFDRTPEQIAHTKGTHRRRDASLRLEPLDCGCLDPFTPHHREVCMRWER